MHIKHYIFSFLYLLLFNCFNSGAIESNSESSPQAPNYPKVDISFEVLKQSDGLSQGMIYAMIEDQKGYIWLGTKDGLNRFDGRKFKIYRPSNQNPASIAEGHITALRIDSKGRLWIGTYSGRLIYFDREQNRFTTIINGNNLPDGNNSIEEISEMPDGRLLIENIFHPKFWVFDPSEHVYTGNKIETKFIDLGALYPAIKEPLQEMNYIQEHFIHENGDLWIFNSRKILQYSLYDTLNQDSAIKREITPSLPEMESERIMNFLIPNLADSNIYYTNEVNNIYRYNFVENEFDSITSLPKWFRSNAKFFVDRSNWLWCFSESGEIIKRNLNNGKSLYAKIDVEEIVSNKKFFLYKVLQDNQNNYWLGSIGHGIFKLRNQYEFFEEVPLDGKPTTMYNFRVHKERNFKLFDKQLQEEWQSYNVDSIMFADSLGWIAVIEMGGISDNDGLLLYQKHFYTNKKRLPIYITHYYKEGGQIKKKIMITPQDQASLDFFSQVDDSLITMIKTTSGKLTIYFYNPITQEDERYSTSMEFKTQAYKFCSDWLVDELDDYWLACRKGVYHFNNETNEWKYYPLGSEAKEFTPTFSILQDPTNNQILWIGTDGYGLYKFHKSKGLMEQYSTEHGLSNNVVYGIQSDFKNNLWLSTNEGLNLFEPEKGTFRAFDQGDGLIVNEFDKYLFSKDEDGKLYFYGEGKLIKVNPEAFYLNRISSEILINQVKIFNQPFNYQAEQASEYISSNSTIEYADQLVFSPSADMISIGFTMTDKTNPKGNRYRYRLKGFNQQWIDNGNETEAIFTSLGSGEYTFEAQGYNSDDLWGPVSSLQIVILPAWWESWWFYSLLVLAISSLIYFIYRVRLNQVLRVERMRNNIARDLHDDIGSTVSSISLYAATLQYSDKDLSDKSIDLIERIIDSCSEVLTNMNDMVWSLNPKVESLEKLINRLKAYAFNVSELKNIELLLNDKSFKKDLSLSINQRKNIYLIFKEAINNTIKHSDANKLSLDISTEKQTLSIRLQDNGKGIDHSFINSRISQSGNGLSNMKSRAQEINANLEIDSILNQGTKIQLEIELRQKRKISKLFNP